ncbi:hypothetical protein [Haladaptatus sp. DFWS20]|uniref:hypothetical protein n=1 Tax=Haladaptatus sp. DFWS20 TaxID=3403467 RepID=UPI003EBEE1A2
MLEDVKVFVLDLLTLSALLTEVDEFGVLFRPLDRLEELATCIGCTRDEIERLIINVLVSRLMDLYPPLCRCPE